MKIPDGEWCGDLGDSGATCFHTITSESRRVEKQAWDQERYGQLCTQPASFAAWKAALEKLCQKTKMCSYDEKKLISDMGKRVESFDAGARRSLP